MGFAVGAPRKNHEGVAGSMINRDEATPIVELLGIRRSFGGLQALSNVSLSLYPGEIVGLLGENGAGKSTLVKILTGVLEPDGGGITEAIMRCPSPHIIHHIP